MTLGPRSRRFVLPTAVSKLRSPQVCHVVWLGLATALAVLLPTGAAAGTPEYSNTPGFQTKYPTYYTTFSCSSCHTSVPAVNAYGTAYRTAVNALSGGRGTQANVATALTSIETADSDGDGYLNLTEINNNMNAATANAPAAGVTLSATSSALAGPVSTTVTYNVTLTNNGSLTDSFTLAVSVISGESWITNLTGTAVGITSTGTASITVSVQVPGGATGLQNSVARVTATSQTNGAVAATPLSLTTTVQTAGTRYVNAATGVNTGTCTTSSNPCKTIAYGMSQAIAGDLVSVSPGTYNLTLGEVFPISLKSGVQLKATGSPSDTIIDATGDTVQNSILLSSGNASVSALVEGFTFQNGFFAAAQFQQAKGGAIRVENATAAVNIKRNIFKANEARALAGQSVGGNPTGGNAAGGAIHIISSIAHVTNNVFVSNISRGGAGVNNFGVGQGGNGGKGEAGALYFAGTGSVTNNTFHGNSAIGGSGGGGIGQGSGGEGSSGAVYSQTVSNIDNNIFANNSAAIGSGLTGAASSAGALTAFGTTSVATNLFFGNTVNGGVSTGDSVGTGSITLDPLFASAPTDLRISNSSPAKAAGTATANVPSTDFDGKTRPSPPSIGAFEPPTVPGAPTIGTATGGNASASVAFTAPASNGGSAITGYTATCGAQSASGTVSPITVTGLTNGIAVTCTVIATNAIGNSAASAASNSVTPSTVPGAPTIGTATAGNTTVSVTFTAPGSTGGSPITGYTATCGTQSASGTTSPITVTGLTNGTAVTCTVIATNGNGNSAASAASNSVTPVATATAPVIGSPTSASVTATGATLGGNVTADGGSAVTERGVVWSQTATNANPLISGSGVTKATVSGTTGVFTSEVTSLQPATGYSFKGFATNAIGTSYTAVGTFTTGATVPGAPTIGTATAGNGSVSVAFTAPASNGGSAITGYTATCGTKTGTGTTSPITVTGLTNGTAVTCTVVATNSVGNSAASSASNSVTPDFTGTSIPRLVNISTRGQVGTGDNILIGGFIVGSGTPKKVIIKGRGPSMAGLGVPGTLSDPAIRLFSGATPTDFNDDWQSATNAAEITASGQAPSNVKESAILTTVNPGVPYTVHVTGVGETTGIAIVEVFELDKPEVPLLNISTRGPVLTGDQVMIGGFIIQGDAAQQVLVVAKGPSLGAAPFNVPGSLPDPMLELYQAGVAAPIETNDNWVSSTNQAAIQASGNGPTNPLESAIIRTLAPGAYTAIVKGVGAFQGVGLVEVYKK